MLQELMASAGDQLSPGVGALVLENLFPEFRELDLICQQFQLEDRDFFF